MPFQQPFPRSFVASSIREYAPAGSGVFGISNAREWIYIGESDNVQASLVELLADVRSEIHQMQPKGFVFEACAAGARAGRLARLISEYDPVCNRQQRRAR